MKIVDELNQRALGADAAIDRVCEAVSLPTARILLDLARGLTDSPLGTGDGNLIRAQRILERRLGAAGKTVIVDGSAEFQRLIAACRRAGSHDADR